MAAYHQVFEICRIQRLFGSKNFKIISVGLLLFTCVLMLAQSFYVLRFNAAKLIYLQKRPADQGKITMDTSETTTQNTKEMKSVDEEDYDTDYMPYLFKKNHKPSFVFGAGRQHRVSVGIGIPHVKRPTGVSYLNKTLDSLTKRIFPDDEEKIAIVVFIAEKDDHAYVRSQTKHLYNRYKREFDSGMLQVIGPPKDFYPDFERLIPNLGDADYRVWWRSKEVIDAALLMLHCEKLAENYLMLEDDVIAAKGYMRQILEYLDIHSKEDFLMVSTATYGSIAKMFKSSDIPVWVSSLLSFYNQKPVDWLLADTTRLLACSGITHSQCEMEVERRVQIMPSSLFLHVGYQSSLSGKMHDQEHDEEKSFGDIGSINIYRNPPVKILSTHQPKFMTKNVESWYGDSGGLTQEFCLNKSRENDNIEFQFRKVQAVTHILLKTGTFGDESNSRMCEGCAALEVKKMSRESKYMECAVSDWAGSLACQFSIAMPLTAFRITTKISFEKLACFSVVYVKVAEHSSPKSV